MQLGGERANRFSFLLLQHRGDRSGAECALSLSADAQDGSVGEEGVHPHSAEAAHHEEAAVPARQAHVSSGRQIRLRLVIIPTVFTLTMTIISLPALGAKSVALAYFLFHLTSTQLHYKSVFRVPSKENTTPLHDKLVWQRWLAIMSQITAVLTFLTRTLPSQDAPPARGAGCSLSLLVLVLVLVLLVMALTRLFTTLGWLPGRGRATERARARA